MKNATDLKSSGNNIEAIYEDDEDLGASMKHETDATVIGV